MPYLIVFAVGLVVGGNWRRLRRLTGPALAKASARFDERYSADARRGRQAVEGAGARVVNFPASTQPRRP